MTPRNRCGPPVRDADFVGREADVSRLRDRLAVDHVLLSAPRRVGKTSVMHHLEQTATRAGGWAGAVYYSAEGDADEAGFVAGLFATMAKSPGARNVRDALAATTRQSLLGRIARVEAGTLALELREALDADWTRLAAAFGDALGGQPPGFPLLVMVDEVPVFLKRLIGQDRRRAEQFLAWFRRLRQGGPERPDAARWLVAGSIGLAPLTAREGWSHLINDLKPEDLGPLSPADAQALLDGLATTYRFELSSAERDALLDRLGWPLPYFIQIAFAELKRQPPGPDRVDQVFASLCSVTSSSLFEPWWGRLREELGPVGARAAEVILDACALRPDGAARSALVEAVAGFWTEDERENRRRAVMECLDHDGYLLWQGSRWRFRSPLLREVWLARRSR